MTLIGEYIYIYGGEISGHYTDCMSALNINTFDLDHVEYENKSPEAKAYHKLLFFLNIYILYIFNFFKNYI